MTDQLALIETHPSWALDASTRELGRRGVAHAREVLEEARKKALEKAPDHDPDEADPLVPAA